MESFTPYESKVIAEIAYHAVEPGFLNKALAAAGRPVDCLLEKIAKIPVLRKLPEVINAGVRKGLETSIHVSHNLYSEAGVLGEHCRVHRRQVTCMEEVRSLPLEARDVVADRYRLSNSLLIGAEGALMGAMTSIAEGIPFAQLSVPFLVAADVSASMTFLSRHAGQIATAYGYSPRHSENIPHVLCAMTPQFDVHGRDFVSTKFEGLIEIVESVRFLGKRSVTELHVKEEAPGLLKVLNRVAARLEIEITEKELGMLLPVMGAVLNGGINIAFQRAGHVTAKNYFRRLALCEVHGEFAIDRAIQREIEMLSAQTKPRLASVAAMAWSKWAS